MLYKDGPSAPQHLQNQLLPVLNKQDKRRLFSENVTLLKSLQKAAEVQLTCLTLSFGLDLTRTCIYLLLKDCVYSLKSGEVGGYYLFLFSWKKNCYCELLWVEMSLDIPLQSSAPCDLCGSVSGGRLAGPMINQTSIGRYISQSVLLCSNSAIKGAVAKPDITSYTSCAF